jgi:PAT family beta-lactamase induction signal transducer AmpG
MGSQHYRLFFWVALLSFGSGFPLLFSSEILKAYLLTSGLDLYYISLLGILIIPYVFSWLWAPVIDYVTNKSLMTHGQLISTVFIFIGCCIHSYTLIDLNQHYFWLMLSALLLAAGAATQDHLVEKYRRVLLPSNLWVTAMGYSIFAFRLAILFSGGAGFVLADFLGWDRFFQLSAFTMYGFGLLSLLLPRTVSQSRATLYGQYLKSYESAGLLFKDKSKFSFLILYRLGFFWIESMAIVYMISELKMGLAEVGLVLKVLGVFGVAIGAFVTKNILRVYTVPMVFVVINSAQHLLLFSFYAVNLFGLGKTVFMGLLIIGCALQGAIGLVSGVWFMQESEADLASFNFSLWYGVSIAGRLAVAPIAYYIVSAYHWEGFFLIGVLVGFISLFATCFLLPQKHALYEAKLSQTS